jgi:TonB family protein
MHSVDLIFLLACTVVNPVCWLVLQEIKIVHEFQADDEVINRHGIDGTDYQRLLIMRTVGAEAYALASSFNLNIKQRIIMMNKEKTRQRRLIWLLMLVPLLGMTSVLFARTDNKADMIESELNDSFDPVQTSKLTQDGFIVGKVIDNDGPIADARVSVINLNGTVSYSSTTDSEGGFVLRTSNRDFTVIVSKPGYAAVMCLIQSDEPVIKLTKDNNLDPAVESIPYEPLPDDVYMVVDEAPDFPGGVVSLLTYLRNNIKYPAECRENNIQGRVIITFTVDTDGTVTDAYVAKSCNPLLDAEALRVISGMPQWTPGKNKGETVKVQYSVPLNFRLDTPGDEQRQPDWLVLHIADGNRMGVSVSGDHQAEAGSVYYMLTGMQSDENNVRRFMDSQGGGVIAGADDIESAIKDLFDGKIANMVVPKTDDNYKKMRAILDRYPDKMVLDTFLGIDELRERGWNIQTVE